jgi:septum formation protein
LNPNWLLSLDKAGAYGAQEWFGQLAIERIVGTFDNVKGLPLDTVVRTLEPWLERTESVAR